MNINKMITVVLLPNPALKAPVKLVYSESPKATMANRLGQTKPTDSQPTNNPIKIPSTCMPKCPKDPNGGK